MLHPNDPILKHRQSHKPPYDVLVHTNLHVGQGRVCMVPIGQGYQSIPVLFPHRLKQSENIADTQEANRRPPCLCAKPSFMYEQWHPASLQLHPPLSSFGIWYLVDGKHGQAVQCFTPVSVIRDRKVSWSLCNQLVNNQGPSLSLCPE